MTTEQELINQARTYAFATGRAGVIIADLVKALAETKEVSFKKQYLIRTGKDWINDYGHVTQKAMVNKL